MKTPFARFITSKFVLFTLAMLLTAGGFGIYCISFFSSTIDPRLKASQHVAMAWSEIERIAPAQTAEWKTAVEAEEVLAHATRKHTAVFVFSALGFVASALMLLASVMRHFPKPPKRHTSRPTGLLPESPL